MLRISLSLVFLWFGAMQIYDPLYFQGYLPPFIFGLNISLTTVLYVNAFLEIILGLSLLVGFLTRLSALILSIHLVGIILGLGYNDVAVRDVGLLAAMIVVFLQGPDKWTVDKEILINNQIT